VNYAGERRVLTGLVGESILGVAQRHRYSFVDGACGGGGAAMEKLHKEGSWAEPKYGEGASCYFCHVVVAKAFAHTLPPMRSDEEDQLKQYPFKEDMSETSRLACQVNVTKE
jgi:ferredoxin